MEAERIAWNQRERDRLRVLHEIQRKQPLHHVVPVAIDITEEVRAIRESEPELLRSERYSLKESSHD